MIAAKGSHERLLFRAIQPAQRERRQLQRAGPSFRALCKLGAKRHRDVKLHRLPEKVRGFVRREAQIERRDLGELVTDTQPRQRQRRLRARRDDEGERRRPVDQRLCDGADGGCGGQVKVVEHKQRRRTLVEVGSQCASQASRRLVFAAGWRCAGEALQPSHHGGAEICMNALQRRRHRRDKLHRVALGFVKAEPRRPVCAGSDPLGGQRSLAITGRCADEQQPVVVGKSVVETLVEMRAQRQVTAQNRRLKFGVQDGWLHEESGRHLPGSSRASGKVKNIPTVRRLLFDNREQQAVHQHQTVVGAAGACHA